MFSGSVAQEPVSILYFYCQIIVVRRSYLPIHCLMDIWVVFTLVGMNNFTGNTQVNVFVWICVFISLEDVSMS